MSRQELTELVLRVQLTRFPAATSQIVSDTLVPSYKSILRIGLLFELRAVEDRLVPRLELQEVAGRRTMTSSLVAPPWNSMGLRPAASAPCEELLGPLGGSARRVESLVTI